MSEPEATPEQRLLILAACGGDAEAARVVLATLREYRRQDTEAR